MKEHIGKIFKVKPEKNGINIHDITFKLVDVDDEFCTIEWLHDKPRISKMYIEDLEYFFSYGFYYWA